MRAEKRGERLLEGTQVTESEDIRTKETLEVAHSLHRGGKTEVMVTWQVSGTARPDQISAGVTQNVDPKCRY